MIIRERDAEDSHALLRRHSTDLCGREKLPGVPAGGLVLTASAEHANDLGDQLVAVDPLDPGTGLAAVRPLGNPEVR
jgi:hypothetical protein